MIKELKREVTIDGRQYHVLIELNEMSLANTISRTAYDLTITDDNSFKYTTKVNVDFTDPLRYKKVMIEGIKDFLNYGERAALSHFLDWDGKLE
jgi:hypothetical protein